MDLAPAPGGRVTQHERFPVERDDGGVVAPTLASPVGWQQREPMLNGRCSAQSRDHFSFDQPVESVARPPAAAAGELRGKVWAWT